MPETPPDLVDQTHAFYEDIFGCLQDALHDGSDRALVAITQSRIAINHGLCIGAMASLGVVATTSMTALLRIQYEATVRGLWSRFAASDEKIARLANLVREKSLKEPNNTLSMDEMLAALEATAPEVAAQMARQLKSEAWKPLNSFVHTGIHPLQHEARGYQPGFLEGTLYNANLFSIMAAMTIAELTGDGRYTGAIKQIQLLHRGCLPPQQAGAVATEAWPQ